MGLAVSVTPPASKNPGCSSTARTSASSGTSNSRATGPRCALRPTRAVSLGESLLPDKAILAPLARQRPGVAVGGGGW